MQAQDDCTSFRKGRFLYQANEQETYLIRRKAKKQIEYHLEKREQTTVRLDWLNDCTYRLGYSKDENEDRIHALDVVLMVNIYNIQGMEYQFRISGFDDLIVMEGKMEKISKRTYRRMLKSK